MSRLQVRSLPRTAVSRRSLGSLLRSHTILRGALPGPQAPGGPLVVMEDRAWLEMMTACRSSLEREQVGILCGEPHFDGREHWVHVTHAFHAREAPATGVHVELDRAAWKAIHQQMGAQGGRDLPLVGWYHTHPNLGAFFSARDRATQRAAFPDPSQFGLVIDPVRGTCASFRGGDSRPICVGPLVARPLARKRPRLPYSALLLPLPAESVDLREAALEALISARQGTVCLGPEALQDPERQGLVLSRPALKRRFPKYRERLSRQARASYGWELALPLLPEDVFYLQTRGVHLSRLEVF